MLYFDYCSTTPVDDEVLNLYNAYQKKYYFNSSTIYTGGIETEKILKDSTNEISKILKCYSDEIIYTSGATESNNLAILGLLKNKKHNFITTKIEHLSVLNIFKKLESEGHNIKYIDVDNNGNIDENQLLKSIDINTDLISIGHINNEIGSIQNINELAKKSKKINKKLIFHTDMAQSVGKVDINLDNIDLASFSSHKFYGPKSIGFLFKKKNINLKPIIFGGGQQNNIRSGTIDVALIGAMSLALKKFVDHLKYSEKIYLINKILIDYINNHKYLKLTVNSNGTDKISPFIINIKIINSLINSEILINAFNEYGIYISGRSACSSKIRKSNHVLKAIGLDDSYSNKTIRISISHLTEIKDIYYLIDIFEKIKKYFI